MHAGRNAQRRHHCRYRANSEAKRLGYDVCCFIGITLRHAGDYPRAIAKLEVLEEVIGPITPPPTTFLLKS